MPSKMNETEKKRENNYLYLTWSNLNLVHTYVEWEREFGKKKI